MQIWSKAHRNGGHHPLETAVIKTTVNNATLWRHELRNFARLKTSGWKHFYHDSMSWLRDLEITTENARCREIILT